MKRNHIIKTLAMLIAMILIVSALAACGETAVTPDTTSNTESNSAEPSETEKSSEPTTESGSETTQSGSETAEPENNVLVIYFSHTGTTKEVAAYLHMLVGGDLVELIIKLLNVQIKITKPAAR